MRYFQRLFFLLTRSDDDPDIRQEAAHVGFLLATLWLALLFFVVMVA